MASENETVADVIADFRKMPMDIIVDANANFVFNRFADRFESAWLREKAELKRKVSEHHLAFLAEKARHTDDYKDERIRAQDAEIRTLKSELKPRRNCDTVADFHDAKRKFKDANAKGPANYCRRLCHWLLAPVTEGGEK